MIMGTVIIGLTNKKTETAVLGLMKKNGFQTIEFEEGNALIRAARSRNVDLIIIDEEIKGFRTLDIVNAVYAEKICPVILVTSQPRADFTDWIEKGWIFNFINQAVESSELNKMVKGAMIFGKRLVSLESEILKLKKTLADRKTIERAKGIIMEMKHCSEEDAYKYLRNTSMEKKVTIENLAKAIINKFTK